MAETERYERALSKVYAKTIKADDALLEKAKLALSM